MTRERATQFIEHYIGRWKEQNLLLFLSTLSADVVIAECNGPLYCGIDEVQRWFIDWHDSPKNGRVTTWDITNIIVDESQKMAAVEWDFSCVTDGNPGSFWGASLFFFDDAKIVRIHEYQMDKRQCRGITMSILTYYRMGMRQFDEKHPNSLRHKITTIHEEWREFREEPSLEELWDVVHTIGRLVECVTGVWFLCLCAWPTVKKHATRMKQTGCPRSTRNCCGQCTSNHEQPHAE